ncbi:magnesium transport protein CorA [Alsobacter metallidurans]|uniref:Magnesium transport protein CorA n=1 Tax=Alsobacter metallidurans TaxID=340221 RepID=A0A917I7S5_9HYPH|nr:magnesium transporter CorA family protein [Alsobacter metallidurans]GGH21915.1 magnesium transport protein CorA [Alsobacter metallidurans]
MLTLYRDEAGTVRTSTDPDLPGEVIWLDLFDPTPEEREFVEKRARVRVPDRDALSEIEASSRLIAEEGVLYLSTPIVGKNDAQGPMLSPVGFVLAPKLLVTIRYAELSAFDAVVETVRKDKSLASALGVFTALLEAVVDRGADVLESLGAELDRLSRQAFRGDPSNPRHAVRSTQRLRLTLTRIGAIGDRVSMARDVLLGVGRIAAFTQEVGREWIPAEFQNRLAAVSRDIASLNDYEAHVSNKTQFLLDAVLGYISIEQNDVFKVLTIASVVGIPPTIMVGVWGMNFKHMPELDWLWGYPLSLVVIVLSGAIPLLWFKRRGWF